MEWKKKAADGVHTQDWPWTLALISCGPINVCDTDKFLTPAASRSRWVRRKVTKNLCAYARIWPFYTKTEEQRMWGQIGVLAHSSLCGGSLRLVLDWTDLSSFAISLWWQSVQYQPVSGLTPPWMFMYNLGTHTNMKRKGTYGAEIEWTFMHCSLLFLCTFRPLLKEKEIKNHEAGMWTKKYENSVCGWMIREANNVRVFDHLTVNHSPQNKFHRYRSNTLRPISYKYKDKRRWWAVQCVSDSDKELINFFYFLLYSVASLLIFVLAQNIKKKI